MVWLGMSARGLTPLVWFKSNVNGTVYREKILDKIVLRDVMERDDEEAPINERKLFEDSKDFIFEQDFATPHSTNVNQAFMEKNFPRHTPTLHRFNGVDELFFPLKLDDFWCIERLWAILAQKAFRHPRPERIDLLMRRVREAARNIAPETLIKLVHELPARMQEIYKQKGKKIPADWKGKNNRYRCRCSVCSS